MIADYVATISGAPGGSENGFVHGPISVATYSHPRSVCADPIDPELYWVGDETSIRHCDGKAVRLVAGQEQQGKTDGTGERAQFHGVFGLVYQPNQRRLIVCDVWNNVVRAVNVDTKVVSTIAGNGSSELRAGFGLMSSIHFPRFLVFDRSAKVTPESAVFIATLNGIARFDLDTSELTVVPVQNKMLGLFGIDCISGTGNLLVTCVRTYSVYFIETATGRTEWLAGTAQDPNRPDQPQKQTEQFNWPSQVLITSEQSVLVCDRQHHQIKQLLLPHKYFES